MNEIFHLRKDDVLIRNPFRICIMGPMYSGKSTLCIQLIKNLYSFVERKSEKTHILLITENDLTKSEIQNVCKENGFQFSSFSFIPNLQTLIEKQQNEKPKSSLILIIEV